MKTIIIGLIILLSVNNVSAGISYQHSVFNGDGASNYPNNGFVYVFAERYSEASGNSIVLSDYYQTSGNTVYYKFDGNAYARAGVSPNRYVSRIECTPLGVACSCDISGGTCTDSFSASYTTTSSYRIGAYTSNWYNQWSSYTEGVMYVKTTPFLDLTVSGNTCGVTSVALYLWTGSGYSPLNSSTLTDTGDSYNYDVVENQSYRLIFSDAHQYDFSPNDTSVSYDRDLCTWYTLNLVDNCANPLIAPTTTIFKDMTDIIYEGSDNPIKLMIGTDVEIADYLQIIIDTHDGAVQYNDYVSEIEQDLYHTMVDWFFDVHVIDQTGNDISGATVTSTQTCSIILPNEKHTISQANGHAKFTGLSASNIALNVERADYQTYSKTITIGNAFTAWSPGGSVTVYLNASTGSSTDNWNNGTHNDTPADGTGEESLPSDHTRGCGVYFKNVDGLITDTIKDTDNYVDMYWWNKGCDATLKFQTQLYTYWYTTKEYTVNNNTYEYRRINNVNFSDHTNSYRGYIYNTSCGCNDIQKLNVINETYQEETDYENLTSHCRIKNKLSGNEIDYRSDIKCVVYANSTNSSLLDITANFMNGSTLVDSKVLNWADFSGGSPKWYYTWYPDYDYTSGYNYTLNITGYDGYQLDTDEVWTSDIIGNTLTVFVKDNHNSPVAYSTVFIEGWGQIATGSLTYAKVTGLPDGNTQYKASKSGYTSSGWNTVTLAGEDDSKTCVLIKQTTDSVTGYKLQPDEIKSFFIPLMYMLFIMMLIGGLMNAAKP